MNDTPNKGQIKAGPFIVRTLRDTSALYEAVVRDTLELIESAARDKPEVFEDWGELIDNLRTSLDAREQGTVAAIRRCCRVLLGEESES